MALRGQLFTQSLHPLHSSTFALAFATLALLFCYKTQYRFSLRYKIDCILKQPHHNTDATGCK